MTYPSILKHHPSSPWISLSRTARARLSTMGASFTSRQEASASRFSGKKVTTDELTGDISIWRETRVQPRPESGMPQPSGAASWTAVIFLRLAHGERMPPDAWLSYRISETSRRQKGRFSSDMTTSIQSSILRKISVHTGTRKATSPFSTPSAPPTMNIHHSSGSVTSSTSSS